MLLPGDGDVPFIYPTIRTMGLLSVSRSESFSLLCLCICLNPKYLHPSFCYFVSPSPCTRTSFSPCVSLPWGTYRRVSIFIQPKHLLLFIAKQSPSLCVLITAV
ncbi:hypothetical protein FKM82_013769 [Ascaphus truei]